MVNFARCKCLGANVLRGPDQIPWDGKLNYDYQLWIDSDIVFNTESFISWYCWIKTLLLDGIVLKMVRPLVLLTGWKKMTSVIMVES